MDYILSCKNSAFPCELTIDEDNGRYLVRKADSSGEYFNSPEELVTWVMKNWHVDQFNDEEKFAEMIEELKTYTKPTE